MLGFVLVGLVAGIAGGVLLEKALEEKSFEELSRTAQLVAKFERKLKKEYSKAYEDLERKERQAQSCFARGVDPGACLSELKQKWEKWEAREREEKEEHHRYRRYVELYHR